MYELKEKLAQHQLRVKQEYPSYQGVVDQLGHATIREIQQVISNDKLFIQYTNTPQYIYLLAINKKNRAYYQIKKSSSFDSDILEFYSWLKEKNKNFEIYNNLNSRLSQQLLSPITEIIGEVNSLIIVPDGILHYLPFEVLSQKDSADYLIESKEISYAYSGSIFREINKKNSNSNLDFLAFSPEFKGNGEILKAGDNIATINIDKETVRGDLSPLSGAYREVQNIKEYFVVAALFKENATETTFKKNAGQKGILHLATHAIIDDVDPLNSYLVLANQNDKENDGYLYAWEIQNMVMNAQMAVLSACNTGYGKLEEGEGIMSLGRAFVLAGCQSVVISYWPAQDQATASIMNDFYKNLLKGQSKEKALRNAKLSFIDNSDENFKHPFYWAGFVLQGETKALTKPNSNNLLLGWTIIILLIIGFGIWLLFFKHHKRSIT